MSLNSILNEYQENAEIKAKQAKELYEKLEVEAKGRLAKARSEYEQDYWDDVKYEVDLDDLF